MKDNLSDPLMGGTKGGRTVNELNADSGMISKSDMNFGDGRRNNIIYYQYSASASQIGKDIKNDLDEGRIDIEFEDVDDVDTWKPSFSLEDYGHTLDQVG